VLRFLLTFACLLAVAACQKTAPSTTPPLPVSYASATTADVPMYVETFGNCETVASVTIVPQVTGILAETKFTEGTFVKAGQPIFQIDPKPYQAAVQQAQGDLETAQANLVDAQQKLTRQQALYKTKVNDVQDLQDAQAAMQATQGNVTSSRAELDNAKINLGYCTINSPIEGKTGPYLINTGNLVTANSSKLVNIQTISPIYVDYTFSEADLGKLRQWIDEDGLDVEVTVPGDEGPIETGKMHFFDNQIASGTGTLMMRATFPNQDQRLWPGQFVDVRVILTVLKNAVVVPAEAVLVGQTGDYVFVLQEDNTLAMRPIEKGQREGDRIVIKSGLSVGEKVVTSGQIALAAGEKVAPVATPTPAPPAR
jgi:multidrug efflux system membrane fusion protein